MVRYSCKNFLWRPTL